MGTIGKFKYYGDDKENLYFKNNRGTTCVYEKEIVKHSKNIIDLIEIGDFLEILADGQSLRIEVDKIDYKHKLKNIAEDIKIISIITREQMKQIEYKVGE